MSEIDAPPMGSRYADAAEMPKQLPTTSDELQKTLTEAARTQSYVQLVGAGTHQFAGNLLCEESTAVSTAGLDRVVSYEPADMTLTIEAGVTLREVQSRLGTNSQFLPLDPPPNDDSTIGGILAANVSGPLRHRYGTARDWLLGLRVVLVDGSVIKSGGKVVKNVSGYDLHKVFVGSLGTLGAIAEVTFKVAPLPRVDRTFAISCSSAAVATGVIMSAHEATLALAAAELLSPSAASRLGHAGAWTALLRVAGGQAATSRTINDLDEVAALARGSIDEVDVDAWARWRRHFTPSVLGLRISVAPSRVGEIAGALDRNFAGEAAYITSTATAGVIRLNMTPRTNASIAQVVDRAREIAEQRGGFLIVDDAPQDYKRTIDVFGSTRGDIAIMRRLKQQFDPEGILAPGRFVGRL